MDYIHLSIFSHIGELILLTWRIMRFLIFRLGAPNNASNKALLSSENSPNPLLDFSMTFL